ncbi:MAG: hypothetical protein OEY36_02935 [Gammaproteobacteria bacterium]|nr:hypothetical protein [Gammaproteobacteria bacterium]
MPTPDIFEQIKKTHAPLIVGAVQTAQNPALRPEFDKALFLSEQNGWGDLVNAIRKILDGDRNENLYKGLDDEDASIIIAILQGLQNPASLPDPEQKADASQAAPMLAGMIHQAARGDVNTLTLLSQMAEQMSKTSGDMAQLSAIIKPLVDGERDVDRLMAKMGPSGESLITGIVSELAKLDSH